MASKYKTGDKVLVIVGKYKGTISSILKVDSKKKLATVGGVNLCKKSVKATKDNPKGGFITKESSISLSNLLHVDDKGKRSRIGFKFVDSKKYRFFKTTGSICNQNSVKKC